MNEEIRFQRALVSIEDIGVMQAASEIEATGYDKPPMLKEMIKFIFIVSHIRSRSHKLLASLLKLLNDKNDEIITIVEQIIRKIVFVYPLKLRFKVKCINFFRSLFDEGFISESFLKEQIEWSKSWLDIYPNSFDNLKPFICYFGNVIQQDEFSQYESPNMKNSMGLLIVSILHQ